MRSSREFLAEALELLRRESPKAYSAIRSELHKTPCMCETGPEVFEIRASRGDVIVRNSTRLRKAMITIRVEPADVVRLVDGTAMLETLLEREAVVVLGTADALLAIASVCRTFIEATLQSPAMHALFERYRRFVLEAGGFNCP